MNWKAVMLSPLKKLKDLHRGERQGGLAVLCEHAVETPLHDDDDHLSSCSMPLSTCSATSQERSLLDEAKEHCAKFPVDITAVKVFVGNINYRSRERDIRHHFEQFGKVVQCFMVKDKSSRRFKGSAFVTFSCPTSAMAAVEADNDILCLDGRLLNVQWAQRKKRGKKGESFQDHQIKLQDAVQPFIQHERTDTLSDLPIDESDKTTECSIDSLDDAVLIKILSYLSICERISNEQVCKRWLLLCKQSWIHQRQLSFCGVFRSSFGSAVLSDAILRSILKRGCTNVESIDLSAAPYALTHQSLSLIGDICRKLKYLDISRTQGDNATLKHIGIRCQRLQTLICKRCCEVGEKGFWWLLKNAPALRSVTITENSWLTGKCFFMLNPNMTTITVENCSNLCDDGLRWISTKCKQLQSLTLTQCNLITGGGLTLLLQECSEISHFECGGTLPWSSPAGLMGILLLKNLQVLDLHHNNNVHDDLLAAVATNCVLLRSLNLEACHGEITDAGLTSLSLLIHLEVLTISYLLNITSAALDAIAIHGKLTHLYCRACITLDNHALVMALSHCDSLEVADFSSCDQIDVHVISLLEAATTNVKCKAELCCGGTSLNNSAVESLQRLLVDCSVIKEDRSVLVLRNDNSEDLDTFYSSDSDLDYCVGDLDIGLAVSGAMYHDDLDDLDDFLANDDPLYYDDMEFS